MDRVPISGFDGKYMISRRGDVINLLKGQGERILKPQYNNLGYAQVALKGRKFLIHRLVATAFIPNPDNKPTVNHINGNPKDNCVENLEWCTQSENLMHAINIGLMPSGQKSYKATITNEMALNIFLGNQRGLSNAHIATQYGVRANLVYKIVTGAAWNVVTGLPRKRYHKLKNAS